MVQTATEDLSGILHDGVRCGTSYPDPQRHTGLAERLGWTVCGNAAWKE
jgi:hypothetical protein